MPDRPTSPDRPVNAGAHEGQTDNTVLAGIALVAALAILFLIGSAFFISSDQKSVDVSAKQPTTKSPTTD